MPAIRKSRPISPPHGIWFRRMELRIGAVCFCAALFMVPVLLPAAGPSALDTPSAQDCRLTLLARQALGQDSVLAPLNLGVSVKNHVATVWGPVPSRDLMRRAEDCVRAIQGIANVANDLHVDPHCDPGLPARTESRPPASTKQPIFEPMHPVKESLPTLPSPPSIPPTNDQPPSSARTVGNQGQRLKSETLVPQSTGQPLLLMPAIGLPQPASGPIRPISPITPNQQAAAVESHQSSNLVQTIDRLRLNEQRYHRVRIEVSDGIVSLHGNVARMEDAIALAQAISRLPGVQRVVLANVRSDR